MVDLGWSKYQSLGDHPKDSPRSDRRSGPGCPRGTHSNRKASRIRQRDQGRLHPDVHHSIMEETDASRHSRHLRSAVGWYKRCDNLSNSGSRGNWPNGIHAAADICHLCRRCCQRQLLERGLLRQDRAEENASHGICLDGILPVRHDHSRVEIRGDHQ